MIFKLQITRPSSFRSFRSFYPAGKQRVVCEKHGTISSVCAASLASLKSITLGLRNKLIDVDQTMTHAVHCCPVSLRLRRIPCPRAKPLVPPPANATPKSLPPKCCAKTSDHSSSGKAKPAVDGRQVRADVVAEAVATVHSNAQESIEAMATKICFFERNVVPRQRIWAKFKSFCV